MVDNNFKCNKSKSITALNIGIYSVTRCTPYIVDMVNHKNERRSFIDVLNKHDIIKNNIFVLDRGFCSENLFSYLIHNSGFFVCRLRNNTILNNNNNSDFITE